MGWVREQSGHSPRIACESGTPPNVPYESHAGPAMRVQTTLTFTLLAVMRLATMDTSVTAPATWNPGEN
jgi:hypothetical protein